jgi:putative ABC transport system substrate-binding protein
MRLIGLAVIVTLSIILATFAAEAQQAGKVYRVGIISSTTPVATIMSNPTHPWQSLFREMRDRGYVEGQNLVLELRSLEGKIERASEVVAQLVRLDVAVIVTVGPEMTRAAKRVTTTVPIVMAPVSGPVEAGLVASLARPGGNITGLTLDIGPELEGKRLELLREVLPKLRRIAYLGTKAEWEAPRGVSIRAAAKTLGLALFLAEFRPNDYAGAFDLIASARPHAIITSTSPGSYTYRGLIAEFAARNRVPSMSHFREFVEDGGLMSYGVDLRDIYRRAAIYVDRILKGARPADLPVEQPTKFELVINMKTAKTLGLTIPQSILLRADQVIE